MIQEYQYLKWENPGTFQIFNLKKAGLCFYSFSIQWLDDIFICHETWDYNKIKARYPHLVEMPS